ncbi:hypothetical protein K2P97_07620 [bacterium]|nr:hypothetical protein [bacterium]
MPFTNQNYCRAKSKRGINYGIYLVVIFANEGSLLMKNITRNTSMDTKAKEMHKSGTGLMLSLSEGIKSFEDRGYTANIVPAFDHFSINDGKIKLLPTDINLDNIMRFENSSDPDDQSILYAISNKDKTIKGLYVDSFGRYHDDLSTEIQESLRDSRLINKNP